MFFETNDFSAENIFVFKLLRKEYAMPESDRSHHAIALRLKGSSIFYIGDEEISAKAGDIVFSPAHLRYRQKCTEEDLYILHFTTSSVMPASLKVFTPPSDVLYKQLFHRLCTVSEKKPTGYTHELKSLFYQTVMMIERDFASKSTDTLSGAISIIHNNFTSTDFSVKTIADSLSISETYLRSLFAKKLGKTPLAYINELKLDYAKELLSSGYYTVAEVSDKCGFCSPYYFSAFIKKNTGVSPSRIAKKGL